MRAPFCAKAKVIVNAHDGADGQVSSTSGSISFRTGNTEMESRLATLEQLMLGQAQQQTQKLH
jgi:hypothetical protein